MRYLVTATVEIEVEAENEQDAVIQASIEASVDRFDAKFVECVDEEE